MKKTASQVVNDLYPIVKSSTLATALSGNVYKEGLRPLNSSQEDVVICFVEGTVTQIQSGVVDVNIFIPDIDNGSGGLVRNAARCQEIEALASEWVESIEESDGYSLTIDQMVKTLPYDDNKQHVVNTKLKFYYTTF